MDLLLQLLIVLIIVGVIYWIVTLLPLPHPFPTIVYIVLGAIVLIYLLNVLFGFMGTGPRLIR